MSTANTPRALIAVAYAEYAHEYLRSLPPEHFMEATAQATQRKITLESLDLVHARRPEVQVFNELLVQYPRRGQRRPGQVVPDNMLVVCAEPIKADGSYDTPLEPTGPFWVLDYLSKHNQRKDYEDSFTKYERDLKVPYYLVFHPEAKELTFYRHTGQRYRATPANEHGRHALLELDLEVGLRDGWVRFWYKGELLLLPGELQLALDESRRLLREAKQRAPQEKQSTQQGKHRAEEAGRRSANLQQQLETVNQACRALERELEQLRFRRP